MFYSRFTHLEMYDGDSNTSSLVGKYCGRNRYNPKYIPFRSFISSSNELFFNFKISIPYGGTKYSQGFQLEYKSKSELFSKILEIATVFVIQGV